MNIQRCCLLIDGSNFYYKLKDLRIHNLLDFNFSTFAKTLAGKHELSYSIYYLGGIRTNGSRKATKLLANQQKLLTHLKNHKFKYSLGYLLKTNNRFHEKGVDVNIAVDILVASYENLCDQIILVSSDTDLLPAIRKAQEKGKNVRYIGFLKQPSKALISGCSSYKLLEPNDLISFLKS